MASLTHDEQIIETVLCETARLYQSDKWRTLPVFDRERGNFLLVDEGWDGYERVHHAWAHIELRGDKFWIHRDGTQDGIAAALLAAGVPKERIVLAFQHLTRRERGEFAAI